MPNYIGVAEKPPIDDVLEHFGVKGMHWGVKKAIATSSNNRRLNKESRAKDRVSRDKEIDAARKRQFGGANRARYEKAKAQYKVDKKTIGTREARKKFDKVKQQNISDHDLAIQAKSGKETVIRTLVGVGGVLVSGLLSAR